MPQGTTIALLTLTACLALAGCASVPPGSAEVNAKVSSGIGEMRDRHIQTVRGLATMARERVQEAWDDRIVPDLIARIRAEQGGQLDDDAIASIVATAAEVRDDLFALIDAEEKEVVAQLRANYATLTRINDQVTAYLASAENLSRARSRVMDGLLQSADIDVDAVTAKIARLISITGDPEAAIRNAPDR